MHRGAAGGCPMSSPQVQGAKAALTPPAHLPHLLLVLPCCRRLEKKKTKNHLMFNFFFFNEQMHKAAKSNQVKNKSSRLRADSCHCEGSRFKLNHRELMCRNKSFQFALLQQSHPGPEHTGQKQRSLLNVSPQKHVAAVIREALVWFCLISEICFFFFN